VVLGVSLSDLATFAQRMKAYNQELRDRAQVTRNVDKGFTPYLQYFKPNQEVAALMQISQGYQGEYGWGVFFQQWRHRCVLSGTVSGRPADEALEDVLWTACAEWASFLPRLGECKTHKETFYFTEDCTHFFDIYGGHLHDLSGEPVYQEASPFRKELIEKFCRGVQSFAESFDVQPLSEMEDKRALCYMNSAVSSRRFQIADGANYWSSRATSFAPPASDEVPGAYPPGAGLIQFGGRVLGAPGEAGTV
jgi:hypothetical protein